MRRWMRQRCWRGCERWARHRCSCKAGRRTARSICKGPDLGRRLRESDADLLQGLQSTPADLAFVLADGLSALALQRQALPLFTALRERLLREGGWTWAPACRGHPGPRGSGRRGR